MISRFPAISNFIALLLATLVGSSCVHKSGSQRAEEDLVEGTIEYPFAEESAKIGKDSGDEKFVIRSTVGQTEYSIEIPGAARDYDIEVPLADMKQVGAMNTANGAGGSIDGEAVGKPQTTDKEFVKDMPKIADPADRGLVEGAFGLGHADGPRQSPSYTMRIAKVNQLYQSRQYEYALIEINNLLTYYPTSVKLYKMKGTILIKTRNLRMAESAWARALELQPEDNTLRKALESLRKRMAMTTAFENPTAPATATK